MVQGDQDQKNNCVYLSSTGEQWAGSQCPLGRTRPLGGVPEGWCSRSGCRGEGPASSASLFLSSHRVTSPSAPAMIKKPRRGVIRRKGEKKKNLQTNLHFNEFLIEPKSVVSV